MAEGVKEAETEGLVGPGADDVEPPPDPETAPYGWTRDKNAPTGWRPKKRPGRGGNPAKKRRAAEPPADVDDDRDPEPSWREQGGGRGEPYKASREQQNEVAALLGLLYSIPADFLITVDPFCFGALNSNLEAVIDATVPIICRSEKIVRWATGASGLILWIRLAAALKPFAVAVFQHHVIHSVRLEQEDDGTVSTIRQDFSAYPAAG